MKDSSNSRTTAEARPVASRTLTLAVAAAALGMTIGISPADALASHAPLGADRADAGAPRHLQSTIELAANAFPTAARPAAAFPKVERPGAKYPKIERPGASYPKVERPGAKYPKVERPTIGGTVE